MAEENVYIVAVSGGVDSVVLLHKIIANVDKTSTLSIKTPKYVIAHFDHGIRSDSNLDAEFVAKLAEKYGLEFELGKGNLGVEASEAQARRARYNFLRSVKEKHKASKIITAHHQDDVLESMVINIVRGTGPRGLSPMSTKDILRPLINSRKEDLIKYAKEKNLIWREDSTNTDEKYLRNKLRKKVMPKLDKSRQELLGINKKAESLYQDIDIRLSGMLPKNNSLSRSRFVLLPYLVQKELMRAWLFQEGVQELSKDVIERCVNACNTLPYGKKIDVDGKYWLKSEKQNILLVSK